MHALSVKPAQFNRHRGMSQRCRNERWLFRGGTILNNGRPEQEVQGGQEHHSFHLIIPDPQRTLHNLRINIYFQVFFDYFGSSSSNITFPEYYTN